jgi:DNA-directed RNA polymerase specialized sigma24 family protein
MVAAMAQTHGPLDDLIDWIGTGAGGRTGRRLAAAWSADHPELADYPGPAEMVRAGWADPHMAATLLDTLATLADDDGWAAQTALALLAPRLRSIATRWARAGVAAADQSDLEADLIAEVLSELGSRPVASPERIVGLAWARVRLSRQRQLRRLVRERELCSAEDLAASAGRGPAEAAAGVIVDAVRSGRLSVRTARAVYLTGVVGWSASEAASKLGCHPHAVRARRCRAVRLLAA